MSKKRGRSTAASKADEGPDAQFAEELLFQLASDDNEPQNPPPAKRGKSKSTSAKILPTSTSKDNDTIADLTGGDLDDDATTAAEGDEPTSAAPEGPSNGKHPAAIRPSSSLRHCDGFDVVRKGSRGRGRQLMVLPGALGLGGGSAGGTAGVKLGTLNTATPGCPVLYVEFPEGRLKCMGRTVHTKGRFFTLYADKVAERATRMDCRDVFDSVVFFGKAWWVGKKEDNPEDEPLPLPDSLHFLSAEEKEAPDGDEPALKTHFGGGNPKSLLAGSKEGSSKKPKNGGVGEGPEEAGDEGENEEDGESAAVAAAAAAAEPARRSSRATKSTATYVEDSDDSENDDDGSSSSSSGSDNEGNGNGGERKAEPNFAAVATENGKGKGKEGGAAKDGVEVFSILDAPTAKRKPVTIGSGKVESAKKTPTKKIGGGKSGPMSSGKGKGKGRRAADGSSDDDGTSGGSSDEGEVEVVAAEPSRRSSRASAVSKVKYTQSSGSEEEEEEDEDDEEDF